MQNSPDRLKKAKRLDKNLEIRVESVEKQTFQDAAVLAGIPLSTWVRKCLRHVAIRELEAAGHSISFLESQIAKEE